MSARPLSIVHAIARLNVGGAALHVLQLAREQQRRGHDVLVVAGTLADGEESMEYVADELGVAVLKLPALQRELSLRADAAAILELRGSIRAAAAGRPPHAHREGGSHGSARGAARRRAPTARDRPHVPRPRPQRLLQPALGAGLPPDRAGARARDRDARSRSATRCGTTSSRFGVAPRDRFAVVPYGFDLPAWGAADDEARRRIRRRARARGRDVRRRLGRAPDGDQAAARPRPDAARARATPGSTPCSYSSATARTAPDVEALARELGVADRCRFVGYQQRIREWYAAFDVSLLTSANEGTPVVAIESLAAERPVVATRAGGTGDGRRGRRERLPRAGRRHDGAGRRLAELAARPRAARAARPARRRGRPRALRDRADGRRARRRLPARCSREGPPRPQADRRQRLGEATCSRCCRRSARRASTPASSASTSRARDAPRFYERLDAARRPVPQRALRRWTSARGMARDVIRAVRPSGPTSLHTHLVHADVYGAIAGRACCASRTSRRGTTTTATCSGRSATSTARSRGRRARLIAISDAVRRFLERPGTTPAKLVTIHYGLDELPAARRPSRRPQAPGSRRTSPLAARGRPPDRAEGPRDAAARVRARRERDSRTRGSRSSAAARSRRRRARSCDELGLDDAVFLPGRHGDPRLARARRRLRPHLALGGVRDRAARGDARLASGRRDARQRRARGRRRRRDGRSSSRPATPTALGRTRWPTLLADPERARHASAQRGRAARRATRVLGRARMAEPDDRPSTARESDA